MILLILSIVIFYVCVWLEEKIMQELTGKGVIEQIYDLFFNH